MVEMDEALAFLEVKKRGENSSQSWIKKTIYYPDGTKKAEIEIDQETDEQERETLKEFMSKDEVSPPADVSTLFRTQVYIDICCIS